MKNTLRIVLSALAIVALCAFGEPSCGIGTSPSFDDDPLAGQQQQSIVCGIGTSPSGPCKK